jgi:hypothetical protein
MRVLNRLSWVGALVLSELYLMSNNELAADVWHEQSRPIKELTDPHAASTLYILCHRPFRDYPEEDKLDSRYHALLHTSPSIFALRLETSRGKAHLPHSATYLDDPLDQSLTYPAVQNDLPRHDFRSSQQIE